jgi:bacillolysin/thermolysin
MKKLLTTLLVVIFCLGVVVNAASVDSVTIDAKLDKKQKQLEIVNKLQNETEQSEKEFKVEWNQEKGVPGFLSGKLSDKALRNDKDAIDFLISHKDLFKLDNAEFTLKKAEKDEIGMQHFRINLTSDDIPVYGAELIIHTDAEGYVSTMNGNMEIDVPDKQWRKTIKINHKEALDIAEASLSFTPEDNTYTAEPNTELFIYNYEGIWQPVYIVNLQFVNPYAASLLIYINGENGDVLMTQNALKDTAATGTGVGVFGNTRALKLDLVNGKYYMRDTTKGALIETYDANKTTAIPGTLVNDTDNNFNASSQAPAVDAHANTEIVYNYYMDNFNRNSFNNSGATMKSTVNYREISSQPYNNAFWNGSQMVYGDGDGVNLGPVGSALDVVAHEFTHAVTDYTADLVYENQSGALNESMSDVFGYLIEGQATDWLMGEDCYTPGISGDAFRSLQNPTLYDQPDHMDDYQYLPNTQAGDWGGVHINSGIPNKAFYLAATTINDNNKMSEIYYRALTNYLTSTSQFIDARNTLIQAATDLYGAGSAEATAIANAFTSVGVGGSTATDNYEPNDTRTAAYGPIASGTTYDSYIYTSNDVDYYYFDIASTGTITVTLSNLAGDYDLYLYNAAGTLLKSSLNGSTTNESITYSAAATGRYYVRVIGYNGVYSTTKPYALKTTYPSESGTGQWYYETLSIDSPHNYINNYNGTNEYSKPGAIQVSVHFSRFETENGYDYVYIKDKTGTTKAQYTGTKSAFWATVDGDKLQINLVTDYSVTAYGYHIDQVAYYADGQLIIENLSPITGDEPVAAPSDPETLEKEPKAIQEVPKIIDGHSLDTPPNPR